MKNIHTVQNTTGNGGADKMPITMSPSTALSSPTPSSPSSSVSSKSLFSPYNGTSTDSAVSSLSLPYQLRYEAGSHGKKLSATKRRIKFQFGFVNSQAIKDPQKSGEACRSNCGNEHEVVLVWSIASGKRLVLCNGQEVHFSATPTVSLAMSLASPKLVLPEQKFQHSWEMTTTVVSSSSPGSDGPEVQSQTRCHTITIVAHATPLKGLRSSAEGYGVGASAATTSGGKTFRQFDLLVDGVSFFDMPHVFELGLSQRGGGMIPARLRAKQKKHFMMNESVLRSPPPLSSSMRSNRPPRPTTLTSPAALSRRSVSLGDSPTSGPATGLVSSASTSSLLGTYSGSSGGNNIPAKASPKNRGKNIVCSRSVTTSCSTEGDGEVEVVSISNITSSRPSSGLAREIHDELYRTPGREENDILLINKQKSSAPAPMQKSSVQQKKHDQNVFIAKKKTNGQDEDFLFGESIDEDDVVSSPTSAQHISTGSDKKPLPNGIHTVKSWGTEATVESLSPTAVRVGDGLASPNFISAHQSQIYGAIGNDGSNTGTQVHRRSKTFGDAGYFLSSPPYREPSTCAYQRRPPLRNLDPNNTNIGSSNSAGHTTITITSNGTALPAPVAQPLPQYDYPAFAALHVSQVSSPPTSSVRKSLDQFKSPVKGGSNIQQARHKSVASPPLKGIGLC